MPTYDYDCSSCGHRFEVFESITASPRNKKCPKCGRKKANRLMGIGIGVVFKGSGFYTTDYARKGSGKPEDSKESKDSKEPKDSKDSKDSKDASSKKTKRKKRTVRKKKAEKN